MFGIKGFPHWTMPGWIVTLPLLSNYLAQQSVDRRWPKVWLSACAALSVALLVAGVGEIQSAWLGRRFPDVFRTGDPTVESVEWTQLSSLSEVKTAIRDRYTFVATKWRDGGKLAQALGPDVLPLVLPDDPHGFSFEPKSKGRIGLAVMIAIRQSELPSRLPELHRYFTDIQWVAKARIGRGGQTEISLVFLRGRQVRLLERQS